MLTGGELSDLHRARVRAVGALDPVTLAAYRRADVEVTQLPDGDEE